MIVVKAMDGVEVVGDQEDNADPFEPATCLHAEDHHEDTKFHQEHRLQDGVIAEKPDSVVVLIEFRQICLYFLSCRVYSDSFLKPVVHQR